MADGTETIQNEVVETQVNNAENQIPQEVRDMMEISLNGGIPPEKTEAAAASAEAAAATTTQEQPAFVFDTFKEKFGYEKPEDIEKEISELRAFKAAPPQTAAEIKFENEESKKYFEAIQSGKVDEVVEYYQQQKNIDNLISKEVTKETAADIIKMGLKLENKDLTDEDVNHRFKRLYSVPKEPSQSIDETDEEFAMRKDEWKEQAEAVNKDLIIDAKFAKPKLEAAKQKLVFPNIESANPEFQEFLQYKKTLEEESKLTEQADTQTKEAYKSFKPEQIKYTTNFKDESNKIDFNFDYVADQEGFNKAVETVTDFDNKFLQAYINQDGTPNRSKFLEDIYFAQNKEKIILEAIKQSKNATIKSLLPDNSNGGLNRIPVVTQGEKTEFQLQMEASLGMGAKN
jgi:hypothetical protein